MAFPSTRDPARARVLLLIAILFMSYLCVAMPLPIVPVFVTERLGLGNVWAGLGVGIAFFSTIATRGYAGRLADRGGAKVALAVLSTLSPRDLQRALALSDKAMIGRAPGVGPKLALRITTELKDKAPAMMLRGEGEWHTPITAPRGPTADAVTALVKLGYSEGQAAEAVSRASNDLGDAAETGALLREALRGMAR